MDPQSVYDVVAEPSGHTHVPSLLMSLAPTQTGVSSKSSGTTPKTSVFSAALVMTARDPPAAVQWSFACDHVRGTGSYTRANGGGESGGAGGHSGGGGGEGGGESGGAGAGKDIGGKGIGGKDIGAGGGGGKDVMPKHTDAFMTEHTASCQVGTHPGEQTSGR